MSGGGRTRAAGEPPQAGAVGVREASAGGRIDAHGGELGLEHGIGHVAPAIQTSGSRYETSPKMQRFDWPFGQLSTLPPPIRSRGGSVTVVCWPATSTPGTSLPSGRLWYAMPSSNERRR